MQRYPSITAKPADVRDCVAAKPGTIWVATPKYHGCNMHVEIAGGRGTASPRCAKGAGGAGDGDAPDPSTPTTHTVKLARRKDYLGDDESFYGARQLLGDPEHAEQWSKLHKLFPDNTVRVYGELYGGTFPGVKAAKGVRGVQGGVYYSPHVQFVAFDVSVDGAFLDFVDARTVCDRSGIRFIPVHFRGLFDEVLEWAQRHRADPVRVTETHVPRGDASAEEPLHSLGAVNTGEGYVIRPVVKLVDRHGVKNGAKVKVKSDRFVEAVQHASSKKPTLLNDDEARLLNHVVPARVASVLSKESEDTVSMKNVRMLGKMVVDDAVAECGAELSKEAEKEALRKACRLVVAHIKTCR